MGADEGVSGSRDTIGPEFRRARFPLLAVSPKAELSSRRVKEGFPDEILCGPPLREVLHALDPFPRSSYGYDPAPRVTLTHEFAPEDTFAALGTYHVGDPCNAVQNEQAGRSSCIPGPDSLSSPAFTGRGASKPRRGADRRGASEDSPRVLQGARAGAKAQPGHGANGKPRKGTTNPAPPSPDDGKPRFCPFCGTRVRWCRRYYEEVSDHFWEMACGSCGRSLMIDAEALQDAGAPDPELPDDGVEVEST